MATKGDPRLQSHLFHPATTQHLKAELFNQVLGHGPNQTVGNGAIFNPPDVEGVLVRERVVIQKFHDYKCRELSRGLEQAHEEGGLYEVLNETRGKFETAEELVTGYFVVGHTDRLVGRAKAVYSGEEETSHGGAVGERETLEKWEGGKDLAEGRGKLEGYLGEHGGSSLEAVGRVEGGVRVV